MYSCSNVVCVCVYIIFYLCLSWHHLCTDWETGRLRAGPRERERGREGERERERGRERREMIKEATSFTTLKPYFIDTLTLIHTYSQFNM